MARRRTVAWGAPSCDGGGRTTKLRRRLEVVVVQRRGTSVLEVVLNIDVFLLIFTGIFTCELMEFYIVYLFLINIRNSRNIKIIKKREEKK